VNNCVGIGNQKLFLLFIFYTALVCGYSLILVISRFASCALYDLECGNEIHFLMILFLFLESLLFLMFTLCMLGDQLSAMRSNQTSIDRLKNQKHEIKVDVNEVCGSTLDVNFHWHWLMPVAVSYSEAITEKILGYRICLSSPNNEEGTPLMEREEAKGVEMTAEGARSKEAKTDVAQQSTPPQVGGARVPATGNEVKQVKIACKLLSRS
jgi:DHHC palmitoyltransferase